LSELGPRESERGAEGLVGRGLVGAVEVVGFGGVVKADLDGVVLNFCIGLGGAVVDGWGDRREFNG